MAPQPRVAGIPSSPSYPDNEAASQQLLNEASSPVLRHSAAGVSANAVEMANLLNNARKLSAPPALMPTQAGRAGKLPKPGKLPRASLSSLVPEGSQGRVRGARVYELDPSPQKRRPHSLPAQVAAFEHEDQAEEPASAQAYKGLVPETNQVPPEGDVPAETPGTGAASAGDEEPIRDDHVKTVGVPPAAPLHEEPTSVPKRRRGRPRKSGESTASAPSLEAGTAEAQGEGEQAVISKKAKRKTRHKDEHSTAMNAGPSNKAPLAKKQRLLNGPTMVSPEMAEFEEDVTAPRATAQLGARPRGDPQPQIQIPIRSTRSQTAQAEAELANAQERSATAVLAAVVGRREKPAPRSARTTRSAKTASTPEPSKRQKTRETHGPARKGNSAEESDGGDVEEASEVAAEPAVDSERANETHGDAASNIGAASGQNDEDEEHNKQQNNEEVEQQDHEQDKDAEEYEERDKDAHANEAYPVGLQMTNAHADRFLALNQVFRFIDSEPRSGVCSTKLGRIIHRRCDEAQVTLSQSGGAPFLDDTTKCKDDLIKLLDSIDVKVCEERRVAFKRDAFAYLFRALTLVLEAMYEKLQEREGEVTESLDAMLIVYPFINQMLRFKDTMDSWKVTVQQRTPGERLIKDAEGSLIAPLRVVEKQFRIRFRQLQKAEQKRQVLIEMQQQQEEQEQELIKKQEMLHLVRERRKRWQDLHIVRMQCEPDPLRRRRLRFVEPVQVEETDSNGRPFERVPFFGERSAPLPHWTVAPSGKEWTKEQETVLLDALQSSAALERIFRNHCGPSGALRDFSVSDFAAKLAWVRSGWAQLSHQHGWEIPGWVKKIPVLP